MMPRQLANAKRRPRHSEPRPTIELMPAININDLRAAIPRDYSNNIYSNSLRYPQVRHLHLSYRSIKIIDHYDRAQVFGIEWIRTGLGAPRAIFVCSCGYGAIRLFARHGTYACRHCHRALYASQRYNQIGRKRLAASKLRLLQLGSLPDIREPMPCKAKWKHHRTYNKAREHLDKLEAPIKAHRFKKPLSTQLCAYHIT
jgi:hypothetical protein